MEKIFDVFIGRIGGWHTSRVEQNVSAKVVNEWLKKGYRVETEHQIGIHLHEVYLVKV